MELLTQSQLLVGWVMDLAGIKEIEGKARDDHKNRGPQKHQKNHNDRRDNYIHDNGFTGV